MRILRLSHNVTKNNFYDENSVEKSEFDFQYFRRIGRGEQEGESSELKRRRERRKEKN